MSISESICSSSEESSSKLTTPEENADEVLIGVMGVTGSGKSTFIQTVSGDQTVVVSDGLRSCTTEVKTSKPFILDGRTVRLVDTPGFNDGEKSDVEVLELIGDWMKTTYNSHTKLTGILYLHRITDIRMERTSIRCLDLFRSICGDEFLKNTILVSTMWDSAAGSTSKYVRNEHELSNNFWKHFLAGGATLQRSYKTKANCEAIIRHLLNKLPGTPQIQHELSIEGKNLGDTKAGEQLRAESIELLEKFKKELEAVKAEHKRAMDANNKMMEEVLSATYEEYDQKIKHIQDDVAKLKAIQDGDGILVKFARKMESFIKWNK